jgi:hypothetical protein
MQRWRTPEPLALPIAFGSLSRLDLDFVNERRDRGTFTAFVFVNPGELPPDAGREHQSFCGAFTVFAPSDIVERQRAPTAGDS